MPKALIVYHSKTGRIGEMAQVIEEGMASTGVNLQARCGSRDLGIAADRWDFRWKPELLRLSGFRSKGLTRQDR